MRRRRTDYNAGRGGRRTWPGAGALPGTRSRPASREETDFPKATYVRSVATKNTRITRCTASHRPGNYRQHTVNIYHVFVCLALHVIDVFSSCRIGRNHWPVQLVNNASSRMIINCLFFFLFRGWGLASFCLIPATKFKV